MPLQPALLYRRVSTDEQSHSLAAQEAKLMQYCQLSDLDPVGEFEDEAVSGLLPLEERPGGGEMMEAFRAGRASHIVVAKLDRLGRSALDVMQTIDRLGKMGITVHIVDIRLDCSTPHGRFMMMLLAAVSELEVAMIRERITTTLADRRARGFVVGKIPYGWKAGTDATGQRILVDDIEQQLWLTRMIMLRAPLPPFQHLAEATIDRARYPRHSMGWHRIATYLNEQGCVARTAPGAGVTHNSSGLWTKSMVESVLTNKYTLEFAERMFGVKAA